MFLKKWLFYLKIRRVLGIILAWALVAFVMSLMDHLAVVQIMLEKEPWNFWNSARANILGGVVGGLTGGSLMIFFIKDSFRTYSFLWKLIISNLIYITLIVVVTLFVSIAYNTRWFAFSLWSPVAWKGFVSSFGDPLFFRTIFTWFVIVSVTSFVIQLSDILGPGVLVDIISGKYHQPLKENRIFMFLDMKSSTTIAEQLGHNRFYELLNDCFRDMTDAILNSGGEIYQYVGDEVVVSWKLEKGLQNANCIKCLEDIRGGIQKNQETYEKKYGFVPEFKAGFHYGEVTTGEIGIIKRVIVFTGDVLNTASRIQNKCNELGVNNLISGDLLKRLEHQLKRKVEKIGVIPLKGKAEEVMLYTLSEQVFGV